MVGNNTTAIGFITNTNATVSDTYYLSGSADAGVSGTDTAVSKSSTELQADAMIALLNDNQLSIAWVKDNWNINGGYPILVWQAPDNDPPTVTFSVNGSSTYVANATTIVNIEDISGVETLKYQWTDSSTAPSESTFTLAFTSGETLTLSSENGQWYLWIYASDTLGNSTIVGSNAFLLDSLSPTGTISISPMKTKNGKKYANTNLVTVNLTVADNVTSEADMKVALVNEEEFNSKEANTPIEWSNFSRTKNWNLSEGEGRKRVYVIFKDGAGNQSLYMIRDMNNI